MTRATGMGFSGKAAIVGIGETDYVRGTDQSILQMILGASMAAIKDAGLKPSDVDAVIPPPGFVAPLGLRKTVAFFSPSFHE